MISLALALLLLVEEELVQETLDGMVKFCASVKSAHCVKKKKKKRNSVIQSCDSTIWGMMNKQLEDLPDKGCHHLH